MFTLLTLLSCGDSGLYAPCEEAADCVEIAPEGAEAACLPKSNEGYCTWICGSDADCAEDSGLVCASFESEALSYCFPSCEGAEEDEEDEDVCGEGMVCRSTGGGSENRKVCFPSEE